MCTSETELPFHVHFQRPMVSTYDGQAPVRGFDFDTFRATTEAIVDQVYTKKYRALVRRKLNIGNPLVERDFVVYAIIGSLRFADMFGLSVLRSGTVFEIVHFFVELTRSLDLEEPAHWSWFVMLNRFGNLWASFGQTLVSYSNIERGMKFPWFDRATGLEFNTFSAEVSMLSIALDPYVDLHSKVSEIEGHWASMKPTLVDMMRKGVVPNSGVAKIMRVITRIGLDLNSHHLPVWCQVDHDGLTKSSKHGFAWTCELFTSDLSYFYDRLFYSHNAESTANSLHKAAFGETISDVPDIDEFLRRVEPVKPDWQCVLDVYESMKNDTLSEDPSEARLPIFSDVFSPESKWRASIAPIVREPRTLELVEKAFGRTKLNFYDVRAIFEGYANQADMRLSEIMPVFFDWLSFDMDPRLLMACLKTCLSVHSRIDTLNSIDMYVAHVWTRLRHDDLDRFLQRSVFDRHMYIDRMPVDKPADTDSQILWVEETRRSLEVAYITVRKVMHGSGGPAKWDFLFDDILNALKQVKLLKTK